MPPPYRTSDFDYEYPPSAIAQYPLADRAASRLLVVDRRTGALSHRQFRDFPSLLDPGDVLVLNASRVMPARLTALRTNGRPAEILLVHPETNGSWLAMVHPGGKLKVGRRIRFADGSRAEIVDVLGGGLRRLRFDPPTDVFALMRGHGAVPLPPYIGRPPEPTDRERYQTVYAHVDGSVAAPTAGLHFTDELLAAIRDRGITIAEIVLHVGPGTFKPVEAEDLAQHHMHPEWFMVPTATAEGVRRAHVTGRRVWAVGTTVVRTLETAARTAENRRRGPESGLTDLFICPPFEFRAVDALLTNFHLPRSTLLMLVAAFGGYQPIMAAYREAVARGYRLYSYGDAMAVV